MQTAASQLGQFSSTPIQTLASQLSYKPLLVSCHSTLTCLTQALRAQYTTVKMTLFGNISDFIQTKLCLSYIFEYWTDFLLEGVRTIFRTSNCQEITCRDRCHGKFDSVSKVCCNWCQSLLNITEPFAPCFKSLCKLVHIYLY